MPTRNERVKRKTSLAKIRKDRLKAAEPSGHGSPRHVASAPLACYLCDGQWRRGY